MRSAGWMCRVVVGGHTSGFFSSSHSTHSCNNTHWAHAPFTGLLRTQSDLWEMEGQCFVRCIGAWCLMRLNAYFAMLRSPCLRCFAFVVRADTIQLTSKWHSGSWCWPGGLERLSSGLISTSRGMHSPASGVVTEPMKTERRTMLLR